MELYEQIGEKWRGLWNIIRNNRKSRSRTLSREEIKELILAATFQYQQARSEYKERLSVRNMCIIELLFCLGLRVGELSALDMADYRPEENTVLIHGKGRKESY